MSTTLFERLFKRLTPLEQFATSGWGTSCSPDDIIVASLLESMAKEPDLWTPVSGNIPSSAYRLANESERRSTSPKWRDTSEISTSLRRSGPDPIEIATGWERKSRDNDGTHPWIYRPARSGKMIVSRVIRADASGNNRVLSSVTIDERATSRFLSQALLLAEQQKKAKEVAAEAKKAMEMNEQKWELAEKLLNMKRNEFGALVPVNQEGDQDA